LSDTQYQSGYVLRVYLSISIKSWRDVETLEEKLFHVHKI